MNLSEIADKLNITELNLQVATDEQGNPVEGWYRHWENDTRVSVSLHKDILTRIQEDPSINSLALQKEIRTAEQGEYTSYRVVIYTEPEVKISLKTGTVTMKKEAVTA